MSLWQLLERRTMSRAAGARPLFIERPPSRYNAHDGGRLPLSLSSENATAVLNCNACPARPLLPPIAWGSGRPDAPGRTGGASRFGADSVHALVGDSPCMWSHGPLES
jgi:hypothetical protein